MKRKNIARELLPWQDSDGEYIHLPALKQALPGFRWELYLIGITASTIGPHRTMPLLGRLRMNAVVVLLSSMRDWLVHYNPEHPQVVAGIIEDLRSAERKYLANLNMIRAEVRAKHGEAPSRGVSPKPPKKSSKPLKVTSGELFKVWLSV